MLLSKYGINLIVNQINYGLNREENFTTNLCKNGYSTHNEGGKSDIFHVIEKMV